MGGGRPARQSGLTWVRVVRRCRTTMTRICPPIQFCTASGAPESMSEFAKTCMRGRSLLKAGGVDNTGRSTEHSGGRCSMGSCCYCEHVCRNLRAGNFCEYRGASIRLNLTACCRRLYCTRRLVVTSQAISPMRTAQMGVAIRVSRVASWSAPSILEALSLTGRRDPSRRSAPRARPIMLLLAARRVADFSPQPAPHRI